MPHQDESGLAYTGGATRSGKLPELRLIPRAFVWHVAEALTEGSAKYEQIAGRRTPLSSNWRQGDLTFFLDAYDHLINHTAEAADGILELGLAMQNPDAPPEDVERRIKENLKELGHAAANIAFLVAWLDSGAAEVHLREEIAAVAAIRTPEVPENVASPPDDPASPPTPLTEFQTRLRSLLGLPGSKSASLEPPPT